MLTWLVLKPFAILALVAGAITLPTPLPLGAPLIAVGLATLVATSSTIRGWLRVLRRKSGRLDRFLASVEPRLGRRLGVALRWTQPVAVRVQRSAD